MSKNKILNPKVQNFIECLEMYVPKYLLSSQNNYCVHSQLHIYIQTGLVQMN